MRVTRSVVGVGWWVFQRRDEYPTGSDTVAILRMETTWRGATTRIHQRPCVIPRPFPICL